MMMTIQIDNIIPASDARRGRAHDCLNTRIVKPVGLKGSSRIVITLSNSIHRHPVPWPIDPDPGSGAGLVCGVDRKTKSPASRYTFEILSSEKRSSR